MLLLEPTETPYDLKWRMFGIHVRVHPMFWLVSLLMGSNALELGLQFLAAWVACVFVSILVHELGHVFVGRLFGAYGYIVLYGFGGLAVGSNRLARRRERIAVSFGGPLAGFVFLGVIFLVLGLRDASLLPGYLELARTMLGLPFSGDESTALAVVRIMARGRMEFFIIESLIFINLLWGLVNLLPVWPLDGGQISRDLCEGFLQERGLNLSLGISLVVAGLLALHSILAINGRPLLPIPMGSAYTAILFGLLALQSFQLLQQAHARRRWTDDHWHRSDWE